MRFKLVTVALAGLLSQAVIASEVNVYSARQESLIKPLLDQFTSETGVVVNLIAGNGNELLKRMQTEGIASPADVFITVDAGNLHAAKEAGLYQPIQSALLEQRIPLEIKGFGWCMGGADAACTPNFLCQGSRRSSHPLDV